MTSVRDLWRQCRSDESKIIAYTSGLRRDGTAAADRRVEIHHRHLRQHQSTFHHLTDRYRPIFVAAVELLGSERGQISLLYAQPEAAD